MVALCQEQGLGNQCFFCCNEYSRQVMAGESRQKKSRPVLISTLGHSVPHQGDAGYLPSQHGWGLCYICAGSRQELWNSTSIQCLHLDLSQIYRLQSVLIDTIYTCTKTVMGEQHCESLQLVAHTTANTKQICISIIFNSPTSCKSISSWPIILVDAANSASFISPSAMYPCTHDSTLGP